MHGLITGYLVCMVSRPASSFRPLLSGCKAYENNWATRITVIRRMKCFMPPWCCHDSRIHCGPISLLFRAQCHRRVGVNVTPGPTLTAPAADSAFYSTCTNFFSSCCTT